MNEELARRLEKQWDSLAPWPEAPAVLKSLKQAHRLGIVTNCSERLGRAAAERVGVPFDVVVTSERAGFYKPHPVPYELALSELRLKSSDVLFVAGSGFDLIGTARVGLDTYWHNRVDLKRPEAAPAPMHESRSLDDLLSLLHRGRSS